MRSGVVGGVSPTSGRICFLLSWCLIPQGNPSLWGAQGQDRRKTKSTVLTTNALGTARHLPSLEPPKERVAARSDWGAEQCLTSDLQLCICDKLHFSFQPLGRVPAAETGSPAHASSFPDEIPPGWASLPQVKTLLAPCFADFIITQIWAFEWTSISCSCLITHHLPACSLRAGPGGREPARPSTGLQGPRLLLGTQGTKAQQFHLLVPAWESVGSLAC